MEDSGSMMHDEGMETQIAKELTSAKTAEVLHSLGTNVFKPHNEQSNVPNNVQSNVQSNA